MEDVGITDIECFEKDSGIGGGRTDVPCDVVAKNDGQKPSETHKSNYILKI